MSTDTTDAERESFLASIKTKIDAGGITQPEVDLIRWYGNARFGISIDPKANEDGRASFNQRRYLHTLREQGFAEPFADDISYHDASALIDAAQLKKKASAKSVDFPRTQKVVEWLRNELAGGPKDSNAIKEAAKNAMFTPTMLRTAYEHLGVRPEQKFSCGRARWYWRLPESLQATSQSAAPLRFGDGDEDEDEAA